VKLFIKAEVDMKTQKHDRRSERTQRLLANALMALLLERRYADLTVQDILDQANIGRSTFYAHYWDKDDLLTSSVEGMVLALSRQMEQTPGELLPSLELFQHVQAHYHHYQALVRGQGIELVLRTLRIQLCAQVEPQLRALHPPPLPAIAITVMAQGIVGTLLALLQWWLETEMSLRPEQLDRYFRQLILPGVLAGQGKANDG
jgi:AcrR family transcriptional regulator